MVHGNTEPSVYLARAPVDGANLLATEKLRHRITPKRHDNGRVDSGYLPFQVIIAGLDLFRQRVAVIGGTAFDHVGDKDIRPFQVNAAEQLIEELTGRTDEGTPLLIFMEARPLTDKQDTRVWIPFTGNSFCASFAKAAL